MNRKTSVALLFLALAPALAAPAWAQKERINLNSADSLQLQELPGIGPALAQRIIDFRRKNGPFKRIEELMNVRGIGEKKFDKLSDRVTVGQKEKKAKPAEKKPPQTSLD